MSPVVRCTSGVRAGDPAPMKAVFGLDLQRLWAQPDSSITVTAQATVFIKAVVAIQVLEREAPITEGMLTLQEIPVGKQERTFYSRIDQVAGLHDHPLTTAHQPG